MNRSVKWGHRKVNGPLDGLHLIPDLIFPVQKIRGTSLPWCCANWTQNIWITNSPQMSDLNPRCFRRKRTIFSEFLRWTPRSLNAKIRIIKTTNPDYIITRKRVGRDRHGPRFQINSGHQNLVNWNFPRVRPRFFTYFFLISLKDCENFLLSHYFVICITRYWCLVNPLLAHKGPTDTSL